jgi:hypothetical protein
MQCPLTLFVDGLDVGMLVGMYIIFWGMPLFLLFNTQTIHIKSIINYSIATFSLRTLSTWGIRTRVFGSIAPRRQRQSKYIVYDCKYFVWFVSAQFRVNWSSFSFRPGLPDGIFSDQKSQFV